MAPQVGGANLLVRCFVDDKRLLDFLQKEISLPGGTLVLIASEKGLTDFPLLCKLYVCIHKNDVWSSSKSTLKHADSTLVMAFMDFLLANQAYAFYGNRFSSFSQSLVTSFREVGKKAQFYNTIL